MTKLEWVFDSAFRFFPVEPDAEMGYVLNFWDAATNKVLALAGRGELRDYLDVLHLHRQHLSLGALAWAACGKDIGYTPQFLIEEAQRLAHYPASLLADLALREPVDLVGVQETMAGCRYARPASSSTAFPPKRSAVFISMPGESR